MTDYPAFTPGDFVIDVEDIDMETPPDVSVVIKLPNTTISQWEIDPDTDSTKTVADENPNYDPEQPVVLVAFIETGLEKRWPEWRQHIDTDELYQGVIDNGVKFYPFPITRLQQAQPEEIANAL